MTGMVFNERMDGDMRPITKDLSQMMLNKAGANMKKAARVKDIRDGKRGFMINRRKYKSRKEKLIEKVNRKPVKLGASKKYTPEAVEGYVEAYRIFLKEGMRPGKALAEAANMAKCHKLTFRKMLRGTYFDKTKGANEKYGLTPYVGKQGRPKEGAPPFDKDAVLDYYYLYQHRAISVGKIGQMFKCSHGIGQQIADGSYYRKRWGEIPPESERD